MPRDIAGNYTLPAGNPVVPNTIIATNWANTTMQDIADALSASLSIDGSVTTAKIADDAVTPPKLAGLDANGMVARISATEFEARTLAGTANKVTVTDGDGVAGNPTLTIPDAVTLVTPTITGLVTLTGGQIAFPATQVPSADANTLDDYEEGTWTPTITFATPGNLNVAYSTQSGTYTKIGRQVTVNAVMVTTTFTHTTSSGSVRLASLPFATANTLFVGAMQSSLFTLNASRTWAVVVPISGQTYSEVVDSGSGVNSGVWSHLNHSTGDNTTIRYTVTYEV